MNNIDYISESDDTLLAEYVLGVLEAEEREAVESMLAARPACVEQLAVWQAHLAPLLDEVSEEVPPEFIWARIQELLGQRHPLTRSQSQPELASWWDSLALWRWVSAGGLAAALVLAVMLVTVIPRDEPVPGTPLTAALQLESGQTFFTATLDAERRSLVMVPAANIELEGRVAELWLIAGDLAPQSLGLLPADTAASLVIPEQLRALADADSVFAISLEPPGGSPTGLPTGPVVAQGVLARI